MVLIFWDLTYGDTSVAIIETSLIFSMIFFFKLGHVASHSNSRVLMRCNITKFEEKSKEIPTSEDEFFKICQELLEIMCFQNDSFSGEHFLKFEDNHFIFLPTSTTKSIEIAQRFLLRDGKFLLIH